MRKTVCLSVLTALLVGLMCSCGGGGGGTSPTPSSTVVPPSYEAPPSVEPGEIELPLTEEEVTFEYWMPNDHTFEGFSTYDDNLFYQWMEEQTGVHIQWVHPPVGSERENFQTMVLSTSFPDFVHRVAGYYDGGVDKAISDGFLVRLNEKVSELMPHYASVVYGDEETFVQAVSDEGNLWGIHHIVDRPQGSWMGLGVRADWLERAGMSVEDCETIDGLEQVLTKFKEYTYDGSGPLWLQGGGLQAAGAINGSYGVTSTNWTGGFMDVDGTAVYSPLADGMEDYVAKMADWYKKGLVNTAYLAENSWGTPEDRWVNSEIGVGEFVYTMEGVLAQSAATSSLMPAPDFQLQAVTSPKLRDEDDWSDIHIRQTNDRVRSSFSMGITTACKDIDLACRYWDYAWSDEGRTASNWGPYEGPEGDDTATYFVDADDTNGDGHIECYQPWLMEKYGSVTYVQYKVAAMEGPTYSIWSREWCLLDEEAVDFTRIWDRAGADWVWPEGVTLTKVEGDIASSIIANCNTAFNEWCAAVITGTKSADTYSTELLPKMEEMNVRQGVQQYQQALDRYYQRNQFITQED